MDDYVRELLAENRRTRATHLDIGNCSLKEWPEELFNHVWLEELSVSSIWWDLSKNSQRTRCNSLNGEDYNSLPSPPRQISRLKKLRKLWLNGDNQCPMPIESIASIKSLENLEVLGLSCTQLRNIAPIKSLRRLRYLDLWNSEYVSSIAPVAELESLQYLDIWATAVKSLTPVSKLRSIKFLNLGSTEVTNLLPLINMIERGIEVVETYADEDDSEGIFVAGCPLTRPPPEIISGGNESIRIFFDETRAQGVDHLYEAKMLIVGEGGAGKTSLLTRLYKPRDPLPEESETTKGISIFRHRFALPNGKKYRLNVWDFGGQEIYHATHQFFLTRRSLYILVDDTRRDSKTAQDEGFKYWLEVIDALSGHSPVLIFQNEKGGRAKAIDETGICGAFTNVKGFFRGDLSKKSSVAKIREAIEYHVQNLPHVGETLPAKWLLIRADIERESKAYPYISDLRYFDIYARHLPFDRQKALTLSRYLHDLGVFLHFQDDPLLRRTIILQNQWATQAVFRMVDDNLVKANFGRFSDRDCQRVWFDPEYCDMHPELLALMQKFELCYRLPDSSPDTWLIPQLLTPSRPEVLTAWERTDDVVIRYRYEFLPKGIVNRLMVRQHRFVLQPSLGWVSGALFEKEGSQVLAILPQKGAEIVLRARGPERKELLSVISSDLDAINSTFHGVAERVKRQVPCCCPKCRRSTEPEYYDLARLQQRRKDGRATVECDSSYATVSVSELLDGTLARTLPPWASRENSGATTADLPPVAPHTVSVFIASSLELSKERDDIDLFFRRFNDRLVRSSRYLQILRCEEGVHAVAIEGSQSEFDRQIKGSQIFVCIVDGAVGPMTEREFDVAYEHLRTTGSPAVLVYFREISLRVSSLDQERLASLLRFRKKVSDLGHYVFDFSTIDALKLELRKQFDLWFEKGHER